MGHIVISRQELLEEAKSFIDMERVLALILKEKGVPMVGSLNPEPDSDQYEYDLQDDPESDHVIVIWRQK